MSKNLFLDITDEVSVLENTNQIMQLMSTPRPTVEIPSQAPNLDSFRK